MDHCSLVQVRNMVSCDNHTIDHDVNVTSLDEFLWQLDNQQLCRQCML